LETVADYIKKEKRENADTKVRSKTTDDTNYTNDRLGFLCEKQEIEVAPAVRVAI